MEIYHTSTENYISQKHKRLICVIDWDKYFDSSINIVVSSVTCMRESKDKATLTGENMNKEEGENDFFHLMQHKILLLTKASSALLMILDSEKF